MHIYVGASPSERIMLSNVIRSSTATRPGWSFGRPEPHVGFQSHTSKHNSVIGKLCMLS